MIRALLRDWNVSVPLSEIINDKSIRYEENQPLLKRVTEFFTLVRPDVLSTPMIGNISCGLNPDEIDTLPIKLTDVFDELCRISDYRFDVVDYLEMMMFYCLTKEPKLDFELGTTIMLRSLRSLPSFLREVDLLIQLQKQFPNLLIEHNAELDVKKHADLYLKYNNVDYFIWTYVNSTNGRDNTMDKLMGNRPGDIPNGVHILAPFTRRDSDDINGWNLYKNSFAKDLTTGIVNGIIDTDYQSFCKNARRDSFGKVSFINKNT